MPFCRGLAEVVRRECGNQWRGDPKSPPTARTAAKPFARREQPYEHQIGKLNRANWTLGRREMPFSVAEWRGWCGVNVTTSGGETQNRRQQLAQPRNLLRDANNCMNIKVAC